MNKRNQKNDVKQLPAFNEMDEFKTEEVVLTSAVETATVIPPSYKKSLSEHLQLPFIGLLVIYGLFFRS